MRKMVIFLIFFVTLGQIFVPGKSFAATTTIEMNEQGFVPKEITVQVGDTVIFENKTSDKRWPASNVHPTHGIYPEFDPKESIEPGKFWAFTFDKAGAWRMHDHVYPQFSGTIIVQGDSTGADDTQVSEENKPNWVVHAWRSIINFFKNLFGGKSDENKLSGNLSDKFKDLDKTVIKGDEKIFNEDELLARHLKQHGVKETVTALRLLEPKFGSCHQPAHRAGHLGYQILGDEAFTEWSAECQSGYYHGVLEAYFKDHGTEDLQNALGGLCKDDLNYFFEHQCIHGIGHGLTAWTNYELPDALKACDQLPKRQDSCWTGVFMENLAAQLATDTTTASAPVGQTDIHITKYLSSDPQYPCNWVEDKYKSSCYFLQTSRMLQIFGQDFKKIADACSKAPEIYQLSCFGSMGRDVGGRFPTDMAAEIRECGWVQSKPMRKECLNGAVQNAFWDPSGQDLALSFCKQLKDADEKTGCYATIFERAPQVISPRTDLERFCAKAESSYQTTCRTYIK